MDVSWITPNLALGPAPVTDEDVNELRALGIRRVLDLRARADLHDVHEARDLELLHLPTPNHRGVGREQIERGIAFIREGLARQEKVYVHCQLGVGRSVLLICSYLVAEGETAESAMTRVKTAREVASPSPDQIQTLLLFAQTLRADPSTFRGVALIAYRAPADQTHPSPSV